MASSPPGTGGFRTADAPRSELLEACVRCGACLQACPTYQEFRIEPDSPRGRVALIKAVHDGHLPLDSPSFAHHIDQCLDCRACETACPMNVQVGRLIEEARGELWGLRSGGGAGERIGRWVLKAVARTAAPRAGGENAGLLAAAGASALGRRLGLMGWLPPPLRRMERHLPRLPLRSARQRLQGGLPARGRERGTVALLHGCVMNVLFAEATVATADVLSRNGWNVVLPHDQGCCGALHVHAGDREAGKALARRNIAAFEASGAEAYIVNAAGCGSALKEYGVLLAGDPQWARRAAAFAARVRDVHEFLVERGWSPPQGRFEARVAYHDACHLIHAQGISSQPRRLLRSVPGLQLEAMNSGGRCCGSAGLYHLLYPQTGDRLLERAVADVPPAAEVLATANPGCHLHLMRGLAEAGRPVRVMHVMEVLNRAYEGAEAPSPEEVPADGS